MNPYRYYLWALTALSLIAPIGCEKVTEEVIEDTGRACVTGAPDVENTVTVDFDFCRSSSCNELLESSCTATLEGTTITVEASATLRHTGKTECTADCQPTTAECETPPLAAGTYTLVYNGETEALVVPEPADHEGTCAGAE